MARSQVVTSNEVIDGNSYSQLIQQGFRRSGQFIYRPHCDQCQACTSVRVPVFDFKPDRSQKRAWSQHAKLIPTIVAPHFSNEHYALYTRYQKAKHVGGGMDQDDIAQYNEFLVETNVSTFMVEFRQHPTNQTVGDLKMVSIVDRLNDGLSAVYTFYAPEPGMSYGTFNVLWLIQQTRALGLKHLYLGYWIEACRKMTYKTRFKPCELFLSSEWMAP